MPANHLRWLLPTAALVVGVWVGAHFSPSQHVHKVEPKPVVAEPSLVPQPAKKLPAEPPPRTETANLTWIVPLACDTTAESHDSVDSTGNCDWVELTTADGKHKIPQGFRPAQVPAGHRWIEFTQLRYHRTPPEVHFEEEAVLDPPRFGFRCRNNAALLADSFGPPRRPEVRAVHWVLLDATVQHADILPVDLRRSAPYEATYALYHAIEKARCADSESNPHTCRFKHGLDAVGADLAQTVLVGMIGAVADLADVATSTVPAVIRSTSGIDLCRQLLKSGSFVLETWDATPPDHRGEGRLWSPGFHVYARWRSDKVVVSLLVLDLKGPGMVSGLEAQFYVTDEGKRLLEARLQSVYNNADPEIEVAAPQEVGPGPLFILKDKVLQVAIPAVTGKP